jgi:tRNA threonylcarbamoyladenosine biosynthesis protein TsaB
MAFILLIETATASCSIAIAQDEKVLAVKELHEKNIHASQITLFIEDVLKDASLTFKHLNAVAVSKGPGSYTGLRIGVSTAKGICFALDIPMIGISTLEAMASALVSTSLEREYYCPMIDARRMEVYTAMYDSDLNEIQPVEAKIVDSDSYNEQLTTRKIIFFGDGASKCTEFLANPNATIKTDFINSARHLAKLALRRYNSEEFEDLAYFEPYYLKDFLILKPKTL